MSLLRHPFFTLPLKFSARIMWAVVWGIMLSPFEQDVRIGFGAVAAVLACALSYSFVSFDRMPLSASRMALYGLVAAGEALAIGTIVLAFLGAFTAHLHTWAMIACAFGGSLFPLYGTSLLYKDNMANEMGSKLNK